MLILLVKVVCWAYVPWGGHIRVEYVRALVASGDECLRHLFVEFGKDNQGRKGHRFRSLELGWN